MGNERRWGGRIFAGGGGGGVKSSGGYVGAAVLWLVCLLALAAPAAGANTVSITSTPANGIAYVAGETITTRFSFPASPESSP